MARLRGRCNSGVEGGPSRETATVRGRTCKEVTSIMGGVGGSLSFLSFTGRGLEGVPAVSFSTAAVIVTNFPGMNGSALLERVAKTRPRITGCPFAAGNVRVKRARER